LPKNLKAKPCSFRATLRIIPKAPKKIINSMSILLSNINIGL